jgi:uncharacterized protein YqgV (UPF0045/DUF77 family)
MALLEFILLECLVVLKRVAEVIARLASKRAVSCLSLIDVREDDVSVMRRTGHAVEEARLI